MISCPHPLLRSAPASLDAASATVLLVTSAWPADPNDDSLTVVLGDVPGAEIDTDDAPGYERQTVTLAWSALEETLSIDGGLDAWASDTTGAPDIAGIVVAVGDDLVATIAFPTILAGTVSLPVEVEELAGLADLVTVRARLDGHDAALADLDGRVTVLEDAPPGGGGGVPDPSSEPDGRVLTTATGAAVWAAPSGGGGGVPTGVDERTLTGSSSPIFVDLSDVAASVGLVVLTPPDEVEHPGDVTVAVNAWPLNRPPLRVMLAVDGTRMFELVGAESDATTSGWAGPAILDVVWSGDDPWATLAWPKTSEEAPFTGAFAGSWPSGDPRSVTDALNDLSLRSSGGSIVAADITDSTSVGRSVLTAADAAAARSAIGAAPTVSPALTGTPTAPTAAPGTATTQVATTEFVSALMSPTPRVAGARTNGALVSRSGTNHGASAAGRLRIQPVWLWAGPIDRLWYRSTVAAASKWRPGIYPLDQATRRPDGLAPLVSGGLIDMSTTAGLLDTTVSVTIPTSGWWGMATLVEEYSAVPTVHGVSSDATINLGVPRPWSTTTTSAASGECDVVAWEASSVPVGVGHLPATCPTTYPNASTPLLGVRYA